MKKEKEKQIKSHKKAEREIAMPCKQSSYAVDFSFQETFEGLLNP